LKCIISENALREENEKLKQELKLYKHNNNSPCHSSKLNLTTSKTRTYSSDHQHTMMMMMCNECNKECKLLSQHLSSRSPNTNKNVNKKILNFNLNNKSTTTTSGKVLYNGSACNSNKKMKIIKEVKNKFTVLNKNKSVNTFGCVTTCCSGSNSGNTGNCVVLDGLPKSPRVNNGFNIKQRLVAQHKQMSVSPKNSCSVSMNNGKGSNSNRNVSNEKEITKIENLLVEIKDHYNNNNNNHQYNVHYTTIKHNYTPDNNDIEQPQQQQPQTYFQYTHSSLQGRAISNGGAYG
jgi:hypothetical protein